MSVLLGCIADDFTGATDLAGMLQQAGMRTIQIIGVPGGPPPGNVDAIVIALKSRTATVAQAVDDTLKAQAWLKKAGCQQLYFKYCSTFDSTDEGNIGPVIEALMLASGAQFTIACPAFPENRRTVYQGHLFVGEQLLSESGMREHPLTPMNDANLVRVLGRQMSGPVGLIGFETVAAGAAAIQARIEQLKSEGIKVAIVDAVSNDQLMSIGEACAGLSLVTGGSGLALGLPPNFQIDAHGLPESHDEPTLSGGGLRAIVCGSCSQATRAQLADLIARGIPAYALDPLQLAAPGNALEALVEDVATWAAARIETGPVAVYATAPADGVRHVQQKLGVERAGALVENALARIAGALVGLGVRQLIVAGGETSGAVVSALNIDRLRIGTQIDPGVPWTITLGAEPIALALKSGNFGSVDFFSKAWDTAP